MTRLLQAMAGQAHGGAEAFFERLAIALAAAGETQRLVIRRDAARAARLRTAGLEVVEVPFGGRLDLAHAAVLRRAVAAFEPRLVLTWMSRATPLCPRGDFVHVGRLGGYYDLEILSRLRPSHRQYARHRRLRRARRLAGRARALSAEFRRRTRRRAPVPRAASTTPEDAPLALALGRLHPNKGFDVLLDAVAQVPRLYLWLAGEGDERAALEARARALGIDDARALSRLARGCGGAARGVPTCWSSSSRREPLGNVVIEAWAAGVPVVATRERGAARADPRRRDRPAGAGRGCRRARRARCARLAGDRALARGARRSRPRRLRCRIHRSARRRALSRVPRARCGADVRHRRHDDAEAASRRRPPSLQAMEAALAPSRAGRQRPLPLGRCRHGADAARHHRSRDRRPAALRARRRGARRQWRDLQLHRAARGAARRRRSPRSRIASCRCISIAATGSISPAICAACMRSRCTIRRRGGWCWRAIRSASSRFITPRRAQGFAFASEPQA